MHIRRNDQVIVLTGTDNGKRGRVLRVIPKRQAVVVEGINYVTRHLRRSPQASEWGRVQKEAPIDVSNVLLFCPKCERGVRVKKKSTEDKVVIRVCKKCGEEIGAA